MLSDTEFVELIGVAPADLKMTPVKIKRTEEGGSMSRAYLVSLRGLDAGDVHALRKLRVFHTATVELDSYMLTRDSQISETQGPAWLDFVRSAEQKDLPSGAKLANRLKLKTMHDLQTEAEDVLEARRQKLRAERGDEDAGGCCSCSRR